MTKFIKVRNIIYNSDEVMAIESFYDDTKTEKYFVVEVSFINENTITFKFDTVEETDAMLSEFAEKLGAI